MVELTRDMQKEITSKHLTGGGAMEAWLIPFAVTLSLTLLAIIIMMALHLWKRSRNDTNDPNMRKRDYVPANTDTGSDEMLTLRNRSEDALVDIEPDNDFARGEEISSGNERVIVESHRQVSPEVTWSNSPPDYDKAQIMETSRWQNLNNMPSSDL